MCYENFIRFSNKYILQINKCYNGIMFRSIKKSRLYLNYTVLINYTTGTTNGTSLHNTNHGNKRINSLINKYLTNLNPKLQDIIPKKYLTITSRSIDLYLINQNVAKEFALIIKKDLLENQTYIFETNPGFGFLTKELLDIGVPFIHLFEKETCFHMELQKIQNEFPSKLQLEKVDLFQILRMVNKITMNTNKFDIFKVIRKLQSRKWEDASYLQIIATVNDIKVMKHLILSTILQTSFMSFGRPTFYFAILPSIWHKYTRNKINISTVMFQTLFNYKVIGSIDRRGFIPWQRRKMKKSSILQNLYEDELCLLYIVKLEPKPNLFSLFSTQQDLIYFWYFVRNYVYRPTNRVIPTFEKIIPGCGLRLIINNYNIFTQFSDLSVNQIYDIFIEFQSWSEFKETFFTLDANADQRLHNICNNYEEDDLIIFNY